MNILVTGAAGFIGFHVAERLLEEGHSVIGLDNINDYYPTSQKEKNIEDLKQYGNFSFYKHDLKYKVNVSEEIDVICHLAAQAGVRYSLENPTVYEESNSQGTLNILEYARYNDIEKVVYASSSSVYGEIKDQPFKETMQLDKPISLYAATKKHNELQAHTYNHLYGIKTIGLRFFTVYGPRGRPDMAPFLFADAIAKGKPIKVFNEGDMKRDFTYVGDIVEGVISAINTELDFEVINLGRGQPVNLLEFIETMEKHMGEKAEKKYLPMQPGDVKETYADISKAKKQLNYQPRTSIDEGVKKFVEWYKQNAYTKTQKSS